jgi:hypothetical protein
MHMRNNVGFEKEEPIKSEDFDYLNFAMRESDLELSLKNGISNFTLRF